MDCSEVICLDRNDERLAQVISWGTDQSVRRGVTSRVGRESIRTNEWVESCRAMRVGAEELILEGLS